MLGLLTPTDPKWVETVEGNLGRMLTDHAHCELKAAQNALSLVGRHAAEAPEIVEPLLGLAQEEAEHLAQVHTRAQARGFVMGRPEPDAYVLALREAAKPEHPEIPMLLDRLLLGALIEARSCERFKVLAEGLKSADLREFYRDLMAAEARHYRLYVSLAEQFFGAEATKGRLSVLAEREARIARQLPLGPTVHG